MRAGGRRSPAGGPRGCGLTWPGALRDRRRSQAPRLRGPGPEALEPAAHAGQGASRPLRKPGGRASRGRSHQLFVRAELKQPRSASGSPAECPGSAPGEGTWRSQGSSLPARGSVSRMCCYVGKAREGRCDQQLPRPRKAGAGARRHVHTTAHACPCTHSTRAHMHTHSTRVHVHTRHMRAHMHTQHTRAHLHTHSTSANMHAHGTRAH